MGAVVVGLPWTAIDAWRDDRGQLHVLVPATPADAPASVREGTALRREAMLAGQCSQCGARRIASGNRAERRRTGGRAAGAVRVLHRPGCPGSDQALAEAAARWAAADGSQDGAR
jgi:hypothetical protein